MLSFPAACPTNPANILMSRWPQLEPEASRHTIDAQLHPGSAGEMGIVWTGTSPDLASQEVAG